jgi:hypothetical protein
MRSLTQQKGMTAIGWLLVLVMIIFSSLIIIKIVPMYLNGYKITSALSSLKADPMARGKQPHELRTLLLRRLDIDMLTDIKAQDIIVTRQKDSYLVQIDYQLKQQLFGNMYVVVIFDESAEVPF